MPDVEWIMENCHMNDGKIIKWVRSKRYMGGKVWSKRI